MIDKRIILTAAGSLSVLIFVVGIWQFAAGASGTTLILTVVPNDSKVTIDSSATANPGYISLKPGGHNLFIYRDGFEAKTIKIKVAAGQTYADSFALVANSQTGTDWLKSHPGQAQQAEAINGAAANSKGAVITRQQPILSVIPYIGSYFRIDFGRSKKQPGDPSIVALYISAVSNTARAKALRWITDQGYNPADYEILYVGGDEEVPAR